MPKIIINKIKVPSINHKYGLSKRTGRFYLDAKYADFKAIISAAAKQQINYTLKPPYWINLIWHTAHDIDNSIKCIMDGLKESGIITDDREVLKLDITKIPIKRGELNTISIEVNTVDFQHEESTKATVYIKQKGKLAEINKELNAAFAGSRRVVYHQKDFREAVK